jgi:large subunit ribosomal protein L30
MAQLKVTQVKSAIGTKPNQRQTLRSLGLKRNQRETLRSLGLKRINDTVVQEDRPEIRGMVATVPHLVRVEEV